jgi:hypothetical protein
MHLTGGRGRRVPRSYVLRTASSLVAATLWAGADVHAQAASVSGRVVGEDTPAGITNATVELAGRGTVLTTQDGRFRFTGVPLREYALRVSALGYESSSRAVDVRADVELEVVLEIAPLALDSVLVDAREIDFDGRVMDPARNVPIMDALVLTDLGHEERTNQRGHFDIDDVLEGSAVRLRVMAFGYLPADTTLVADDDERRDLDLVRDTLVERLIAMQVARIEERAGERLYEYREAFDRDALARYPPSRTVASIMEARYSLGILRRVFCIVLDEEQVRTASQRRSVLLNMFPHEIERLELLEFRIEGGSRAFMLRVYTRAFFQRLIAENRPLRPASIHAFTEVCT